MSYLRQSCDLISPTSLNLDLSEPSVAFHLPPRRKLWAYDHIALTSKTSTITLSQSKQLKKCYSLKINPTTKLDLQKQTNSSSFKKPRLPLPKRSDSLRLSSSNKKRPLSWNNSPSSVSSSSSSAKLACLIPRRIASVPAIAIREKMVHMDLSLSHSGPEHDNQMIIPSNKLSSKTQANDVSDVHNEISLQRRSVDATAMHSSLIDLDNQFRQSPIEEKKIDLNTTTEEHTIENDGLERQDNAMIDSIIVHHYGQTNNFLKDLQKEEMIVTELLVTEEDYVIDLKNLVHVSIKSHHLYYLRIFPFRFFSSVFFFFFARVKI